ncbi:MAG: hypothetical protein AAF702_02710 [Chloroflexota bacterium]
MTIAKSTRTDVCLKNEDHPVFQALTINHNKTITENICRSANLNRQIISTNHNETMVPRHIPCHGQETIALQQNRVMLAIRSLRCGAGPNDQ